MVHKCPERDNFPWLIAMQTLDMSLWRELWRGHTLNYQYYAFIWDKFHSKQSCLATWNTWDIEKNLDRICPTKFSWLVLAVESLLQLLLSGKHQTIQSTIPHGHVSCWARALVYTAHSPSRVLARTNCFRITNQRFEEHLWCQKRDPGLLDQDRTIGLNKVQADQHQLVDTNEWENHTFISVSKNNYQFYAYIGKLFHCKQFFSVNLEHSRKRQLTYL